MGAKWNVKFLSDSLLVVPMTMALVLKSRIRRKSHVRFRSGGEGGDSLTDHNLGAVVRDCPLS
jgi:hypothetical protein